MFKSLGFVVGLCVALVLTMILLKLANTDRRARTQYDERQALIRGIAEQDLHHGHVLDCALRPLGVRRI